MYDLQIPVPCKPVFMYSYTSPSSLYIIILSYFILRKIKKKAKYILQINKIITNIQNNSICDTIS